MDLKTLENQIQLGEDSRRQFKVNIKNAESLAAEFAAMANTEGGTIYIGIADDGAMTGLELKDVGRINQLISNASSNLIKSPINIITQNIAIGNGRLVISVTIPRGINKPYFDNNGVIWLKSGSDKRRINSREELQRLFQFTDQIHADEVSTNAQVNRLDKLLFRDFLKKHYKIDFPEPENELKILLSNMNLADKNGLLNLAAVLLFAEEPEWIKPQFVVKAICYPGNQINSDTYLDTEDFSGPMSKIFTDSLAFIMRNLHKLQAGGGVNDPGYPEIPKGVFEELLVNALIHRDYFISAPIRLFIYDNRIEIISPGHLPNNLTIEKIKAGNSNIRNPILVSFAAKGLLPYHGLGSGIRRALDLWPQIEFSDDRSGNIFKVTVRRPSTRSNRESSLLPWQTVAENSPITLNTESVFVQSSVKSDAAILKLLKINPNHTIPELARKLNLTTRAIEKQLAKLKKAGKLVRQGSKRNGWWQVKSPNNQHPQS